MVNSWSETQTELDALAAAILFWRYFSNGANMYQIHHLYLFILHTHIGHGNI